MLCWCVRGLRVCSYAGGTDGNAQAAANPSVPGQPPAAKPAASSSRPYCLWMVLQQMLQNGQPGPVDQQGHLTCVPIHIDMALPDYIVKPDTYMKGMIKTWAKGERFRMYFGGKVRRHMHAYHRQALSPSCAPDT